MKVKFWGVRGSIPCPGGDTVKYGGNTPCIELRLDDGSLIIVDSGSGIRALGNTLMANDLKKGAIQADIYLTHTHWDHILGFPFFTPIYLKGTRLNIYGPVTHESETLEEIVGGQLAYRYFPVRHTELMSTISYISVKEGMVPMDRKDLKISTTYLNHPVLCFGYRFEHQGKVVCTAYDTEPFYNVFCEDPNDPSYDPTMAREGREAAKDANDRLDRFLEGADLLITDAQYTRVDYHGGKKGWGHSAMEDAIALGQRAHVKQLALFHFDPVYSDAMLDRCAEALFPTGLVDDMKVFFAIEGMEIII